MMKEDTQHPKGRRLLVRTSPTIFLNAALQLIISMFQGKPGCKNLFAQFLSSAKSIGSIRAKTKQSRQVVICQLTPHLPLLQQLLTGMMYLTGHDLPLPFSLLASIPNRARESFEEATLLIIQVCG